LATAIRAAGTRMLDDGIPSGFKRTLGESILVRESGTARSRCG
jgi:hypothetical protein